MSDSAKSGHRSEKQIFFEALEKNSPEERAAFLAGACGTNPVQRAKVEALLADHFQQDAFMKEPALAGDRPTLKLDLAPEAVPAQMLGRYKLLEKIGEGGFGEVWMAEQREPVKRRVALKIIKLGMDSRQIVARFEAERQALAMMDHPNIAKIFDAGTTENIMHEPEGRARYSVRAGPRPSESGAQGTDAPYQPPSVVSAGRPYFVMELVRGIKITEYCDQNQLPTQERLRLFILVCQAIQHAHQKGIIHRDIKPSNILVTLHDGVPVPKVIDFGIAKATQQELTDKTVFTQFQQFIGTPAYISPEQAEMSGLDIDTRADIYSLGVLLYELLVGQTPFDAKEMMQGGLDALRQIIREKEPLRPSTKLNTLQDDARTTAGKRRQTDVGKLVHQLQGDLDWIVMKCLEKDRTRRYDTANGLAMDIQRHLANEPVIARPPSAAYKLQKAWQRNKLTFTAAAAVAVALLIGIGVSVWQAQLARLAQRETEDARLKEKEQRLEAQAAQVQAEKERNKANEQKRETRRRAYAAEINVAFQALAENNLGRAIELLNRQRPKPGEEDLRGFEWRHLWQRCQPDEKVTFRDAGGSGLAFSPDGRWLAYAGDRIVIRELPSQAVVKTIPNAATTLAFSPDGKLLASGHDSHVRLWSTESWEKVQSLPDARYPAVFSPDGQWLVTGTIGGYRVWNTETWDPMGFCAGEPTFPYQSRHAVAFSLDGKLLVTAGHPGGREVAQFQVWDFPSLTVRSNFASFPFKLGSAVFAPDGKNLLIGDNSGGLMFWDVAEGRVLDARYEHTGGIMAIAFARDGQTFATASADRTVMLWDAATREVAVRLRGHLEEVSSVAISPDGRTLASRSSEGTTKLWDASTRHERRMLPECGLITGFSADSRLLVVQSIKNHRLWRLADGAVTAIPLDNFHFKGLDTWADVHGVEPYAVFGLTNGVVEHWNLATMTRVVSWQVHETGVATAAFSPDGNFVATSSESGDITLWEVATQREVRRFPPLRRALVCLAFSPDGRLLAGSEGDKPPRVGIWDVNEGRLLRELDGHNDLVPSVAFSPDSKLLATADYDNTARLWEISSGNLKAALKGHVQAVMGVAFSPDGKTLATGGDDRKVRLWNIATEQEVATLELLPGGCRSLRFSPDGRSLAVGAFLESESYMWLWQVPSFEEIAAVEAKANAPIKQP